MARPNKKRTLDPESVFADRIEAERNKRNLSYEALAKLMTAAGCPIQPSAIQKIEKGTPRRRIVVNEALAFALVFDLDIRELMISPATRMDNSLNLLAEYGAEAYRAVLDARGQYNRIIDDAVDALLDPMDGDERFGRFFAELSDKQDEWGEHADDSITVTVYKDVLWRYDDRKGTKNEDRLEFTKSRRHPSRLGGVTESSGNETPADQGSTE